MITSENPISLQTPNTSKADFSGPVSTSEDHVNKSTVINNYINVEQNNPTPSIFSFFEENAQKEEDKSTSKPNNSGLLYKLSNDVSPSTNNQDINSLLMNTALDENNSGFSSSDSEPGFPEHKENKEDHLIKKYNKSSASIEVTTKEANAVIQPFEEGNLKKSSNAITKSSQPTTVFEAAETPLPSTPAPTPATPEPPKEDVVSLESVRALVCAIDSCNE